MNRKIILYMSVSLDGYVADYAGNPKRLSENSADSIIYPGHETPLPDVDTVIMGMNTYRQIIAGSSPEEWPYQTLKSYIFTHTEAEDRRGIAFIQRKPAKFLSELRDRPGKNIWICGGPDLANQLMDEGIIDEYHLHIMPVVLGGGIPLFNRSHPGLKLCIESVRETDGIIDVIYSA